MPLVFVHGVNNRLDEEYKLAERDRNALFAQVALRGVVQKPQIFNPYWGEFASKFYWNHGCLPGGDNEKFGSGDDQVEALIEELGLDAVSSDSSRFLRELARIDFPRAVDLLFAAAALADDGSTGLFSADSSKFAELAAAAARYASENPVPPWLKSEHFESDAAFQDAMAAHIEEWRKDSTNTETFGIGDAWARIQGVVAQIGNAAGKVWQRGKDQLVQAQEQAGLAIGAGIGALTNPLVRIARPKLHLRFAYFVGDVFEYLKNRGERGKEGPIVERVAGALAEATKSRTAKDPLIVVAHSFGGPICYDILTHYRPELHIDLFITVGSQVAFFEEAKLYHASSLNFSKANDNRVPQPKNITKWINVFDPVDPVGFAVEKVFDGPKDHAFHTRTHVGSAHSFYFIRPLFHKRLAVRIKEALGEIQT
ncbi:MAG: hypothetical protein HY040_09540 [Planctomycetes bacterium]|nr:hypothetical protein [Planctomycetota bacterium]